MMAQLHNIIIIISDAAWQQAQISPVALVYILLRSTLVQPILPQFVPLVVL